MSADAYSKLVYGVKASEIYTYKEYIEKVTKYDSRTGKPKSEEAETFVDIFLKDGKKIKTYNWQEQNEKYDYYDISELFRDFLGDKFDEDNEKGYIHEIWEKQKGYNNYEKDFIIGYIVESEGSCRSTAKEIKQSLVPEDLNKIFQSISEFIKNIKIEPKLYLIAELN